MQNGLPEKLAEAGIIETFQRHVVMDMNRKD